MLRLMLQLTNTKQTIYLGTDISFNIMGFLIIRVIPQKMGSNLQQDQNGNNRCLKKEDFCIVTSILWNGTV